MTIPMQWALRRRMMMAALDSGVDVANLLIQGSCTFTDYGVVTMGDGNDYRLLAITQSGNLVIFESDGVTSCPVNCEVCVVGGGANGELKDSDYSGWSMGGAGAYMKNQTITAFQGGSVIIGAAQGTSSIGGISVGAVSGKNGGTGGGSTGGSQVEAGGTGDGISKYPFGDTAYSLWAGKPHCGGGGGAGNSFLSYNDDDERVLFVSPGGNGGTNGGNGSANGVAEEASGNGSPGNGGAYGGGRGGYGSTSGNSGQNATYYGSGGGGWGNANGIRGSSGAGYQGIVYIRIPVNQSLLAA